MLNAIWAKGPHTHRHTHMQSLRQIRLKGSCGKAASCILLLRPKTELPRESWLSVEIARTARCSVLGARRSVFCARCSRFSFPVSFCILCVLLCVSRARVHCININKTLIAAQCHIPFFLPCNIQ